MSHQLALHLAPTQASIAEAFKKEILTHHQGRFIDSDLNGPEVQNGAPSHHSKRLGKA